MSESTSGWDFLVSKSDFAEGKLVAVSLPALDDGQIRLSIERLALTANNLTYAVAGDRLGFWSLFDAPAGYGRIPAWGHAVVEASRSPDVHLGERFFGMLPMSSHWTLSGRRTRLGLRAESPQRALVNPVYNQYARVPAQALERMEHDVLFRPLFITSYVLDLYLRQQAFFGARTVWVTSASSKTALGMAHRLRGTVVAGAVTSHRNVDFVQKAGCYSHVVDYEQLHDVIHAPGDSIVVDFSGDPLLIGRLASVLGPGLKTVITVGSTHWTTVSMSDRETPGYKVEAFFGPEHIQARIAEWGPLEFERRLQGALDDFHRSSASWFEMSYADGAQGIAKAYHRLAQGEAAPNRLVLARTRQI